MSDSQRMSLSAERRVILVFIISALAGIVLVGGALWFFLQGAALAKNRTFLETQATMLARQCESEISGAQRDLEFFSKMPAFQRLSGLSKIDLAIHGVPETVEVEKRHLLAQLMNKSAQFSVLFILRPNGDIYLEQPFKTQLALKKFNLADRLYFQEAVHTKKMAMSDSLLGAGGMTGVAILIPILAESGEVASYLGAFFYLSNLSQLVNLERIKPFDAGFIVDRKGQLIAHTATSLLREGVRERFTENRPLLSKFLTSIDTTVGSGRRSVQGDEIVDPADSKRYLRVLVPLSSGWGLGLMRNRAAVLDEARPVIWGITSLVGLLLTLIGGLGVAFAHGIGRRWDNAERALRVSETKFRDLAESMPQLIWTCRGDGPCDYLNPRWVEYTGIPEAEQLGFGWLNQLHPDDRDRTVAAWNAAVESNTPFDVEFRIRRKDGIYRWFKTRAVAVRDDKGRIVKWYGTNTDVEDQKRAEETLRASEARYRSYVDVTGQIAWVTNAAGEIVEDVPSFRRFTGQTYEEVRGMGWAKVLHPDDIDSTLKVWQNSVITISPYETEYRMRRHDGVYRDLLARGFPVLSEDGSIREWVGTCIDITERNRTQKVLLESEERFRATFEQAAVGIAQVCLDGRWLRVNQRLCDIVGYTHEELLQCSFQDITHPEDLNTDLNFVQQVLAGEISTYSMEKRYIRKDRLQVWVNLTVGLVRDEVGAPKYFVSVVEDIAARKLAEEEVHKLNAELEQRVHDRTAQLEAANKELEAFSYSVSHDLRAPLRHVQGYVEMLAREAEGRLTDNGRRYMETIADASREMGELIDDLLAFSRMGRAEMFETSVNLDRLVQGSRDDLESATRGRNIDWIFPPLPAVQADPAMLKLALANLLGNAVKFTRPRDPAKIEMGTAGMEDGRVILFVRDNGVGFDPQYAHKLFGVFQRLHRADEFEGTGIGLANVRRIIARHGGRKWAEGALDRGATFYFTLRAAQ